MRTTLILDDELMQQAAELTAMKEKTAIVHAGLRALLAQQAQRSLAEAGGSQPRLRAARRRKPRK